MSERIIIGMAQLNPTAGDLSGNAKLLANAAREGAARGCDLVVASEQVISGYPVEDLVLKPVFLDAVERAVGSLAQDVAEGPALLIGAPWRVEGKCHNAALLLDSGAVSVAALKWDLPNYGVFDEKRVFAAGPLPKPIMFRGARLGIMVCEDMWTPAPARSLKDGGAEILVVINGSPFETDKPNVRFGLARERVAETGLPLIYVNQVGGQDELVFDGVSFALDAKGGQAARLPAFESGFEALTFARDGADGPWQPDVLPEAPSTLGLPDIYGALVLGLRDYVRKNRFPGVLIGLSGGVDSALTAVIAVDALGADKVHCVMMPSPYTSDDSLEDAAELARLLGVRLDSIPIGPAMKAFDEMLGAAFKGTNADTTEENIQARARGITLMALSNKFGNMVVSTGNKSEMSVGYSTLYGDLCGGYSVLKDVYKTTVYQLGRWRNEHRPAGALGPEGAVTPDRIFTKAPSAELRPDQTDQDSLPPYDVLDDILKCLIEGDQSIADIVACGHDRDIVMRIWRMLNVAEYKRRQAPPGVKITSRSFGRDRRYPITNAFTEDKPDLG